MTIEKVDHLIDLHEQTIAKLKELKTSIKRKSYAQFSTFKEVENALLNEYVPKVRESLERNNRDFDDNKVNHYAKLRIIMSSPYPSQRTWKEWRWTAEETWKRDKNRV